MKLENNDIDTLVNRYPQLEEIKDNIIEGYKMMEQCYLAQKKVIIAGNGGSASDAEHMTGELMKSFRRPRVISSELKNKLCKIDYTIGKDLAMKLEGTLTALPLVALEALTTAYINDVDGKDVFAQQMLGYGRNGDVYVAISTSGNSENVINAAIVAKALGIGVIGLTGADGGRLAKYADVLVPVPEKETYLVQELHLPIYHWWCMMLEKSFF